jgi:hypothetical protein
MFGNDFIYDILYYIRRDDRIYAASQSADVRFLFDHIYRFENWRGDQLYQGINSIVSPAVRPVEKLSGPYCDGQEVITYLYPVKPFEPYATIVFLLTTAK